MNARQMLAGMPAPEIWLLFLFRSAFSGPLLPTHTPPASRGVKPVIHASAFSFWLVPNSQVPVLPALSQPLLRFEAVTLLRAYVRSFSASGLRMRGSLPDGSFSE